MYHFFVKEDQISGPVITITGPDVNHIRNVLRMRPGEQVLIGDGVSRDYLCRLRELGGDKVTAEIISQRQEGTELPSKLYLFQGLPKGDKMEWIIQKAVELGAYRIVPVETRRTVVKLDAGKAQSRVRRWNAVAESAAKQSGRILVPQVAEIVPWRDALKQGQTLDLNLIPYENARGMAFTQNAVEQVKPGMSVGIFIGPEGGFEEEEVREAQDAGFLPISLGTRILRTETAGMAMLSILMYRLEIQGVSG